MSELGGIARTIVSNLHQSYLFRILSEWYQQDSLQIREDLGISSYAESVESPAELFEKVRKHILTKSFQDDEMVNFLLNIPDWVGFRVDTDFIDTGEQAIQAAKRSVLALIWILLIPRVIIGHTIVPVEFENQGIGIIVEHLLQNDATRKRLDTVIDTELDSRGFGSDFFNISDIVMGYKIADATRNDRFRALIALVIMKATDCPYDLDSVFPLNEKAMITETEAYIITMHAQNNLSSKIKGSSSVRPFAWPLVGTTRVFTGIMNAMAVMSKYSSRMTTCALYKTTVNNESYPWTESEFMSFLLNEISDQYANSARTKSGKVKNEELDRFIDLLRGENLEIVSRVMESNDKTGSLHEELLECKRRARIGEKPQISPERRFRVVLSTLKQSLQDVHSKELPLEEIVDQIAITFDAIPDLISKHQEALGVEVDKFTEELCFDVSFRILDLLDLGRFLSDLPWVTRFIAEESTMIDISKGDIRELRDDQRTKRIVSAFAGSVAFLVMQARK
ncbi:MAG: hypothetical protein RTU63_01730 [Candidatus Thorarchaeota archaeon]